MSIVPSDSYRSFLETSVSRYQMALHDGHPAAEYLEARGITERVRRRFRLGVVDDPLPGHEEYQECIVIPYLSALDEVVTIRFRNIAGYGPKYISFTGDPPRIYNAKALDRGTRGICITEGEFDAQISELCGLPTVGVPGATSWNPIWNQLFAGYPEVFVLQDDDEAGRDLAHKIMKELPGARSVVMNGGDVNEFYLTHGRDALRAKVLGGEHG